jgi:hypothetical protein
LCDCCDNGCTADGNGAIGDNDDDNDNDDDDGGGGGGSDGNDTTALTG